jgi:hypothetical protein
MSYRAIAVILAFLLGVEHRSGYRAGRYRKHADS